MTILWRNAVRGLLAGAALVSAAAVSAQPFDPMQASQERSAWMRQAK